MVLFVLKEVLAQQPGALESSPEGSWRRKHSRHAGLKGTHPCLQGHRLAESILFYQGGITYGFLTIKREERARSHCLCRSHGQLTAHASPLLRYDPAGDPELPGSSPGTTPHPVVNKEDTERCPGPRQHAPAVGPRTPSLLCPCAGTSGWTEHAVPLGGEATETSAPLRASVSPPVT